MIDILLICGGLAAGFAMGAIAWPSLRTWLTGAEAEIAQLKSRAATLESSLNTSLSKLGS